MTITKLDFQFQTSLSFLTATNRAVTKMLNAERETPLSESDVQALTKLQAQIKDFNIERQHHEFSDFEKETIVLSVKKIAQQLYAQGEP